MMSLRVRLAAVAVLSVIAAPLLAGEADLTDSENAVVRVLEKLSRAEDEFKAKKVKTQDGEALFGTLDELVKAKLAEGSWASVEGYTVQVVISEELPNLLYLASATPPKSAANARHFAITNGGVAYVARKPLKADPKVMETFALPPEKGGATAVKGRLSAEEKAEREAKLAKVPLASAAELDVLDTLAQLEAAVVAYALEHGKPAPLDELARAKLLEGDLAAGKAHGYAFKVVVGGERFLIHATPATPGPGAHHFLRAADGAVFYSEKPIEPDANGAAPAGVETVEDMVAKTFEKLEAEATVDHPGELLALRALRAIAANEATYRERRLGPDDTATYATLKELIANRLADESLAKGERWGYVFAVAPSTKDAGAGFVATATPKKAGTGARSLFVNHKRELRASKDPIKADPATCEAPAGTQPVE